MFKKNPKTKQFDMFCSPSGLLCEREGRLYYGFRRKLCKYEEKFKKNLFDKCFKQITKQQALSFFVEDAAKIVYRSDSETMVKCLLTLGIVIDYILTHSVSGTNPYCNECSLSNTRSQTMNGRLSLRTPMTRSHIGISRKNM